VETEEKLNAEIVAITMQIQENYSELLKYLNEMPVTIPNAQRPEINAKNLKEYYDSLSSLLQDYILEHKIKFMDTKQIVLASRPKGTPGLDNFKFENIDLPPVQTDEVLVQGLYYSVDPYMRGRMNDAKSYAPPFQIGQPIQGAVVARVLESKSKDFKVGDITVGMLPWRIQTVVSGKGLRKIDANIAPPGYYLGILGMTGLTAYFGLLDICKPNAGETVVVSGAAGAVGIVVGQIAKIKGCRVIGIAGSDEKVKSLKDEFGFDEAINYKTTPDLKAAIARLCPNAVDIYFDNVGGEISDAVIANINFHARIALCGQISLYNSTEIPVGPRLQPMLLTRSALMQGFIVGNYQTRFPEGIEQLTVWVKEGKLKFTETIIHGFDQLPTAFVELFKGVNTGKMVVEA
jgi:NADPH-dependent curcumin reductase CurA